MLCLSKQSVHYSLPPLRKCNNIEQDRGHPRCVAAEHPWPEQSNWIHNLRHYSGTSLPEKVQDVNDLMQHLIDVWAGVKQSVIDDAIDQWRNWRLHACVRVTGYFEYSPWHTRMTAKTFKLCFNLLLNKTFLSDYRSFPDIYVPQGSVAICLRCGGIANEYFIAGLLLSPRWWKKFENRSTILAKLWARVGCSVFWLTGQIILFIGETKSTPFM